MTENQTDQSIETNTNPITPAQFTTEEFEQLLDVYKRNDPTDKTGEKGLVSALVSEIKAGKPFADDFFSEEGLYSGKAKWLETIGLGGQPLNAPTILSLLATDMEGTPVQEGTVKAGLKSGLIPGMFSTAAFASGFYTTNAALQLNPLTAVPVTPAQMAARVILPTAVGIYSSIIGFRGQ